jgi:hypothetical protein
MCVCTSTRRPSASYRYLSITCAGSFALLVFPNHPLCRSSSTRWPPPS